MKKCLMFLWVAFSCAFALSLTACVEDSKTEDVKTDGVKTEDGQTEEATPKEEIYSIYTVSNPNVEVLVQETGVVGEEIKMEITPQDGYYLQAIKVNGESIASKTFVMPKCDVLIEVLMVNGDESYPVTVLDSEKGSLFTTTERAKSGEEVTVKVIPEDGYRLDKLYANGVLLPYNSDDYGCYSSTIMQSKEMVFEATFKEVEKITADYDYVLTASTPENPAVSYWHAVYSDTGVTFSVLVEDKTIVNTASISLYNNDNVEFQICKSTKLSLMDKANAYRCLVTVGGRYYFQKANGADLSFDHSSKGVGMVYGENFEVESILCNSEVNGFDGYAVEVYIGYDILGLTKDEAYGNLTFAPSIRDSIKYDYTTKELTTYWTGTNYTYNRSNGNRFFVDDDYKCKWGDPATFLGIDADNKIVSRFMEVYQGVDYLFMGDSYINPNFWGTFKEDTADIFALNLGFSGSHLTDWNQEAWLNTVGALSPKNIVMHLGLNDYNVGLSAYSYAERVTHTIDRLKTTFTNLNMVTPNSKIYWVNFIANPAHGDMHTYYQEVNAEIAAYAETVDYLEVISTGDALLVDGNICTSLFLADNLHMSCFGYMRWVNIVRKSLGLSYLSDFTNFGNAQTGWASSGWNEVTVDGDTILTQRGSSSKFTDRYIYFKDYYGDSFTAEAAFNVSKIYNGDTAPKFGFIINDGKNQVYIYFGTNNGMKQKTIGYFTRTPAASGSSWNWSEGKAVDINCYFTDADWANLEIIKVGSSLKVVINDYEIYNLNLDVCWDEVSVGIFAFNTELNVKNAKVEVK